MGLISKEVEVGLCGANIEYYEKLGYEIPRYYNTKKNKHVVARGTKIKVKVSDLPDGSGAKVYIYCDHCKKIIKKSWVNYQRVLHIDGASYCRECSLELFNLPKSLETRINQSKSFAQWCIDNIDKNFLDKYWDIDKNNKLGISPWNVTYASTQKVWVRCQNINYHPSYKVSCNNFTDKSSRCPYCSGRKVHPNDSIGKILERDDLLKVWSEKNKKSPYKYTQGSHYKAWWKCENDTHKEYQRRIKDSNRFNFRCPKCVQEKNESFLQEKVREYCNNLGYNTLHEYDCSIIPINPKTKYPLPFDNEIVGLKLIIEVHGRQHYELGGWYVQSKNDDISPKQQLEYQQWKDKYKKDYALSQGYFYLEVPHWADDKDETWKKLINNKINEIKHKKEVI